MQVMDGKGVNDKRRIIKDWYEVMDMEKFKMKYLLAEIDSAESNIETTGSVNGSPSPWVKAGLGLHEQWTETAKIEFTPTIFINGFQLPKQYNAGDIKMLIRGLNESLGIATSKNQKQENHYTPA